MGRQLQQAYGQDPQCIFTMPLLEGLDDLIRRWCMLLSFHSETEIAGLQQEVTSGSNPKNAKVLLTHEIDARFHGAAAADAAEQDFGNPYVLIQIAGYSATAAGAALLPIPIAIALASPSLGRIAGRLGPRRPLTAVPLLVALGFVWISRVDPGGSYWTTTFPAMLVIAFGMACAVAPLTNALLDAVQTDHTGIASGLNSAVARTGGLVSTALLSFILAAQSATLQRLFEVAMLCAAAAALAAAVCAFVWLKPAPPAKNPRTRDARMWK